ncbi:MAG: hypothetical protein LLF98_11265 [Clostridium sp.]|uniref:hypothetical protein n=1 Tax=Clostridium sp. TaxID=1506 RepID=UPI0025BF122C|nr:hypothetical protein [Clostridium sp.]MCE5221809.1 hypothetical protein [Clostridium sp.]
MSKKTMNKNAQEEFLRLTLSEQIELLNNKISTGGTEAISDLGFSYTWVTGKMAEQGCFYVASIKKFIKEDIASSFTDKEVAVLRAMIQDYDKFKNAKSDIRMSAGTCGEKLTTRSITLDSQINLDWNKFCKNNSFVSNKDLVSYALKSFMSKYGES